MERAAADVDARNLPVFGARMYKRILVAVDGSETSRLALDHVTLKLDALAAATALDAVRIALGPCRERLLVAGRPAVADDLAGYIALARERAVPLLLAPAD